jgi:acetolactate synthase-1/2/3 large subunit
MGYGLPAAIGVCIANNQKTTICLEGDGSIMMNLQELQTIVTYQLPIKVFLINNKGYHSIRITQKNLFGHHSKVGIGPESGYLSFPDFNRIANAFYIPYYCARNNEEMRCSVDNILREEGYALCEIFTDTEQVWEPKSSVRRLDDGRIESPPLEDLAPFLSREELAKNMYIPMLEG